MTEGSDITFEAIPESVQPIITEMLFSEIEDSIMEKQKDILQYNVEWLKFAETKATASIISSIQLMQSIQRNQQIFQVVTPGEQIIGISQVDVEQDPQDPRQYNIRITVITGAQTVLQLESFSISTTLDQ